jgi:hypothetical protein
MKTWPFPMFPLPPYREPRKSRQPVYPVDAEEAPL